MAKTKDDAVADGGFRIFDKAGKTGDRVAINLATGVAVETDGAGRYVVAMAGLRHVIASGDTLEALVGLPEPEGA